MKVFQNAVINVGFEVSAWNLILEGSLLKAVPEDEIQKTEFQHYMIQAEVFDIDKKKSQLILSWDFHQTILTVVSAVKNVFVYENDLGLAIT